MERLFLLLNIMVDGVWIRTKMATKTKHRDINIRIRTLTFDHADRYRRKFCMAVSAYPVDIKKRNNNNIRVEGTNLHTPQLVPKQVEESEGTKVDVPHPATSLKFLLFRFCFSFG